ncbi:MAG: hypothetical protein ACR2FM_01435 [Candidatus Saccharimonadales bacterium]
MKTCIKNIKRAVLCGLLTLAMSSTALAAPNPTLTQMITAGVLSTDILDASRNPVAAPSVAMSTKAFAIDCQTGVNSSSGILGTDSQRLYVNNPGGANNGWTLTLAATSGPTSTWANAGATNKFDFNDPSACTDGADADTQSGQLSLDPSVGTLTTDCSVCTTTGVTKGASSAFSEGVTNSLTVLSAAAGSDDVWRGYLTGGSIKQVIPGETPADSYTINLTLTATAL